VVSIFTYRDERKLFAVIGAIVIASLIALIQIEAARSGRPGAIAVAVQSAAVWVESGIAWMGAGARSSAAAVRSLPGLASENRDLRTELHAERLKSAQLSEALAQQPDALNLLRAQLRFPAGVPARVVAYDPENVAQTVTIDRGSRAGVHSGAGVVTDDGVVGRVLAETPFASTVQLVTDATSKIPAVVQRGRWWGIATGVPQSGQIALEYLSQDAKLRIGDVVVSGEGRSFHAGIRIGRIVKIFYPQGALYQTAILTPAVPFGRLDRVLVLRQDGSAP
jgi:rod shape-determining protein MreC